jgi:hypothetical protein
MNPGSFISPGISPLEGKVKNDPGDGTEFRSPV